ncbi:MAG TPA: polymer-forming cytoskeletal protein [Chiayiivirga sp.]|nr:polymer-forming cytoskeletal protein [Chiayiivirga sp.]
MFGDNKKKAARPSGGVETLIGPRARICGDVHFDGGLYVEGVVEGAVLANEAGGNAVLTVSENGRIEGEVRAPIVILNGQLVGDVYASQRIELGATARVEGNIHYAVVEMAAGSMITGRLIHENGAPKQLTGPNESKSKQKSDAD